MIFEGVALTTFPMTAAKFGLMVITVERYFKIVHAIAHRKYYRNWMTKVCVALPWIGGACLMLIPSIGTTRIVNGRCLKFGVWPNKEMKLVSFYIFLHNIELYNFISCLSVRNVANKDHMVIDVTTGLCLVIYYGVLTCPTAIAKHVTNY